VQRVIAIAGLFLFLFVLSAAWKVATCEFANYELKDDLHDVAAMGSSRIGLLGDASDNDLRDLVIQKAAGIGIPLLRDQVIVRRSGSKENPEVFLATRYRTRVSMPGFSLVFRFTATSR